MRVWIASALLTLSAGMAAAGELSISPFAAHVAEGAASDRGLAAFYRETGYADLWTGADDAPRRQALVDALDAARLHGLPAARYAPADLRRLLAPVRDEAGRAAAEVAVSRLFLAYAHDVQTGILTPAEVDPAIKRTVPVRADAALLGALAGDAPEAALRALLPGSPEYGRLFAARMRLIATVEAGGWGEAVPAGRLQRGDGGSGVAALRDRLVRMDYLARTASAEFDPALEDAVMRFQADHGLTQDGVVGPDTLGALNVPAEDRLAAVTVAMERERWLNLPEGRGERHVWVNLTDFRTRLYDDGKVTFETKSVVGAAALPEKHTPEFSDVMEYMEINPDWTVPRSILGRDYLPKLQADPGAAPYLDVIDRQGRTVPRAHVDFRQYTEKTFPFTLRQAPGAKNALGTVKFMFPNPWSIYLHDTPEQHLMDLEVRAYSSGCIRLDEPHEFAYALLARQMDDPAPYFQRILDSRRQTTVSLERPIPVHLVYRTAFTEPKGKVQYRRDIYGRDAKVWRALQDAGVELTDVRS